jgi:hypothetical protein
VAALAMALGLPYETVSQAAPLALRDGLTPRQLQSVATTLGARLLSQPDADLGEDDGIVGVEYSDGSPGHWLYARRGTLFDPGDGTAWDPDDFLAIHGAVCDVFFRVAPALQPRPRQRGDQARQRR